MCSRLVCLQGQLADNGQLHRSCPPRLLYAVTPLSCRQSQYVLQVLNGTLGSPNCGAALTLNATTYRLEVYYAKAVNYTLMITTLSFLQARQDTFESSHPVALADQLV